MLALLATTVFAFAGVSDVAKSFAATIITFFSGIVLGICDYLIGPIFSITGMSVAEIAKYIPGFDATPGGSGYYFVEIIDRLALALALILALAGTIRVMRSDAGAKVDSPAKLMQRLFVFVPLVIFGRKLLTIIFDTAVSPIAKAFANGIANNTMPSFTNAAAPLTTDVSNLGAVIIGTVLMVMIAQNLIELILEASERYIICIFIIFLSPLAFALGVNEETAISAKNWVKMFWSHCMLLILNIWVVGIAMTCFNGLQNVSSPDQILVWGIVTYGYLKIAQKLDDMMQNSGLMVTRTGGNFLSDFLIAGKTVGNALRLGSDSVALGTGLTHAALNNEGLDGYAEPIKNFAARHPIAGAPFQAGVLAAGAASAVQNGSQSFAEKQAAGRMLDAPDSLRLDAAAGKNAPKYNSSVYTAAATNKLSQLGFGTEEIAAGAKVEALRMNKDGSLSGSLVSRDLEGNVSSISGFTISKGADGAIAAAQSRNISMSPDGKSAIISDAKNGTYQLEQTGVDKNGNNVWNAKRLSDAEGNELSAVAPGVNGNEEFSFRVDKNSPDGEAAQAVAAFDERGVMDKLTTRTDEDLANVNKLNQLGFGKDEIAGGATIENMHSNDDGSTSGQLVQRDESGNIAAVTAFSIAKDENGAESIHADRSITMAANGEGATIHDAANGDYQLSRTGTDKFGNEEWSAKRVSDGSGTTLDDVAPGSNSSEDFAFRLDKNSTEGAAAQAVAAFESRGAYATLTERTDSDIAKYAQIQSDKVFAAADFDFSDGERLSRVKDENSGVVNYGDAAHLAAAADVLSVSTPQATLLERGGRVERLMVGDDGALNGAVVTRDANGYVTEESVFSLSTPRSAGASSSDSASADDTVARFEFGDSSMPATSASNGSSTRDVEEVFHCTYDVHDDASGFMDSSDLGKLQVTRISADEATGNTRWQVVRKHSDDDGETDMVTFERRGVKGAAETVRDVMREIRRVRDFDEVPLVDSKNKDRPDGHHLFE